MSCRPFTIRLSWNLFALLDFVLWTHEHFLSNVKLTNYVKRTLCTGSREYKVQGIQGIMVNSCSFAGKDEYVYLFEKLSGAQKAL